MAGFRTHITVSSALGVGYAAAAYWLYDVPAPTCVLAGGLCGVSGMLPDLDSDSGIPLRESIAFASAVVPMLLMHRLEHWGLSHESMILAGAGIYLSVRFGIAALLKRYTVHRGMFHSLPAALIAGQVTFLLCTCGDLNLRLYKAGAVVLGFLSHLVLDELWSLQWRRGRIRLKSSSGTAVKMWSDSTWANLSTYVKLAVLTLAVLNDPIWADSSPGGRELHHVATSILQRVWK